MRLIVVWMLVVSLAVLTVGVAPLVGAESLRPNIVLMVSDDQGSHGPVEKCNPKRQRGSSTPEFPLILTLAHASGYMSGCFSTGCPDLGCIGRKRIQTPHLDRLAAGGVRLTNFYVTWPVLSGRTSSPRQEMFWEFRGDKAARIGQFKWLESAKGNGLFDLPNDPGEEHDLSAAQPEVAARIRERYAAWRKEMDAAEPRGPFRDY